MEKVQLILALVPWSPAAAADLSRAEVPGGDSVEGLRARIVAGKAALFAVILGQRLVAHFVLAKMGRVCRVISAAGAVRGVDLVRSIMPAIENIARADTDYVTAWTYRPGMVKKLRALGYRPIAGGFGAEQRHVILRKALA